MKQPLITSRSPQQGYILISTIIMVLLITLLALAGVSFNSTQTRIATNSNDAQIAVEAAEGALRQVSENIAFGLVNYCVPAGAVTAAVTNGNINVTCVNTANESPLWQASGAPWYSTLPNGGTTYQGNSSTPPTYIVEGLPSVIVPTFSNTNPLFPMRITVQAAGAISTTPQVMLQTIIMIPFH